MSFSAGGLSAIYIILRSGNGKMSIYKWTRTVRVCIVAEDKKSESDSERRIDIPSLPEAFELVGWEGASSTASSCPSSAAAAADGSCDYRGDWLVTKR